MLQIQYEHKELKNPKASMKVETRPLPRMEVTGVGWFFDFVKSLGFQFFNIFWIIRTFSFEFFWKFSTCSWFSWKDISAKNWRFRVRSLTQFFDFLEPMLRFKTGSVIFRTSDQGSQPVLWFRELLVKGMYTYALPGLPSGSKFQLVRTAQNWN